MTRYAAQTHVPVDRSKAEIERILVRYGADQFIAGWREGGATVAFRMANRLIRFNVPTPAPSERSFVKTETGRSRSPGQARLAWEQACRQRWRALALAIKAKLEAVESGIVTFDEEFLPYIVLPNGQTIAQMMVPQIQAGYEKGQIPKTLTWLGEKATP